MLAHRQFLYGLLDAIFGLADPKRESVIESGPVVVVPCSAIRTS